MNKVTIFKYEENKLVRTMNVSGEPWFVLKDVCDVLGLSTPARVAERLDSDEVSQAHLIDSMGRSQEMTIISESGLYNVILRSDKPEAKPFRKWVTAVVLPSIRKNGGYIAGQEELSPQELMHSKMTERLGVNTRQNPQSLLNHTLTNVADEIAELWEFGVDVYHSQYTSSATGVSLDYAAQFGGSTREMAAKSYYSILCTGLDGTTIPAGTVIASDTNPATSLTATADATITRSAFNKATVILASPAATTALGVALNGNLYTITPDPKQSTSEALEALGTAITDKDFHVTVINDTIVIEAVDETSSNTLVLSENLTTASVGSIVTFETAEPGDIFIPNGVITKITKAVPGMESVVNVGSYVAGQLAESDVEFRKSYTNKIYNRSSAMLESIKSAILKNVQGVVSVAPYENCTNEVDSAGRWPHSIEVVVEGGDATEIAQQILNTKAGGINTFGSVETTLHGVYGEDIVVRFNRPTYVKVWFKVGVTLSPNTNPPTNYVELVKEQILEKMSVLGAGENVIPQKFNLQVSGIDYIDVWLFATPNDGDMPTGYTQRSVSISARERAVTDENRIEVVMDG